MTEAEYIEATNLAKIRIAASAFADVLPGYGPVTQEKKTAIYAPLAQLLDECFAAIDTSEPSTTKNGGPTSYANYSNNTTHV